MVSWRDRESAKRARCREQNEATAQSPFRCECGDGGCSRAITLTQTEYAAVREYPTHFAVAPNHENPESEQVIEENERFAVVETVAGNATKLARRSDPRQRLSEQVSQ